VSGIQRYESGQPIAFACATGVPAYAGCIRFNQIPGSKILSSAWSGGHFNPITDSMFNPVDFPGAVNPAFDDPNSSTNLATRGTYAFGTLPRVMGNIRMRPYLSEDFNIMKVTKITEGSDLRFEANFLNALNRHIWNRPGDLNPNDGGAFGLINYGTFSSTGGGGYLLLPRRVQFQLKV
jgi:hypothetical protein